MKFYVVQFWQMQSSHMNFGLVKYYCTVYTTSSKYIVNTGRMRKKFIFIYFRVSVISVGKYIKKVFHQGYVGK